MKLCQIKVSQVMETPTKLEYSPRQIMTQIHWTTIISYYKTVGLRLMKIFPGISPNVWINLFGGGGGYKDIQGCAALLGHFLTRSP